MADSMSFDFTELDKLAVDLGSAAAIDAGDMRKLMQVAAKNVDKGWSRRLNGSSHASGAAASISYDIKQNASETTAEIGPELKGQGPIAGLIEMGSPKQNLAPHGYGLAALHDEEDDFVTGSGKVLDSALKKANL